MVKVISTPGPKAIYIEKLKLAVLYKLDNHEIFPRLRGLFSSILNKNGGSIPVCTERKATGLFVLASFLFATMNFNQQRPAS